MKLKVWGKNAVSEAVESGKPIEKVYMQYGKFFPAEFINSLKSRGISYQWCKRDELSKLAGTRKHQGIVAILSPIPSVDPRNLLDECLKKKSFIVLPDGITEPQNIGVVSRSVEVFGGLGLLLPLKGVAPINETAIKASSGALFHLKVARTDSPAELLLEFRLKGGSVYALETGGNDIRKVTLKKPLCLVIGSEGKGISKELLSVCDDVIAIPTSGKVGSLNVSVATGIAIWEIHRSSLP